LSVVENLYRSYTQSSQKLLTFIEYYYFYFYSYMEDGQESEKELGDLDVKELHEYLENLIVKEIRPDNWLMRFYRRLTGAVEEEGETAISEEYDCILPYGDMRELLKSVIFSPFLEGYVPSEGRVEKIDRFLLEVGSLLDKKEITQSDLDVLIGCYNKYLGGDDDRIIFIESADEAVSKGLIESYISFTIAPRLKAEEESEEEEAAEPEWEEDPEGFNMYPDATEEIAGEENDDQFSWRVIFESLSERMNLQIVVRFERNFGYTLAELSFEDRNHRLDLFSWIEFLNFTRSLGEGERVEDKLEEGYENWERVWNPEVLFTPDIFSHS
jgi:hypothetical protein